MKTGIVESCEVVFWAGTDVKLNSHGIVGMEGYSSSRRCASAREAKGRSGGLGETNLGGD